MAFTLFGSTSSPADNGTSVATQITLTPPTSMQVGDLVYVRLYQRGTATFSVGVTGGQTWNSLTRQTNTNIAVQTFWCRFNGTWGADPRFDFSAGTNTNAVMLVFRPSASGKAIAIDGSESQANNAAAATQTITGRTTGQTSTVTIASWTTADDNTWGTLSGTGWDKTSLSAQYRNTSGSDMSSTFAYRIMSATGATNDVSQTQLTLGNDATTVELITFYEYDAPSEISESASATESQSYPIDAPEVLGSVVKGADSSAATTRNVTLPSSINAGELLIIAFSSTVEPTASLLTDSTGGVWRRVLTTNTNSSGFYWKYANGSEDGITIAIASASAKFSWVTMRIGDPNNVKKPRIHSWMRDGYTSTTSVPSSYGIINGTVARDLFALMVFGVQDAITISNPSTNYSIIATNQGAGDGVDSGGLFIQGKKLWLAAGAIEHHSTLTTSATGSGYNHALLVSWIDSGLDVEVMKGITDRRDTVQCWFSQIPLDDTNWGIGQSFTASGGSIKKIIAPFLKQNAAQTAGTITCKIYAHSGTFGSTSIPTGTALATSNAINISDIVVEAGAFYHLQPLEFEFATPYQTTDGTNYVVTFEISGNGTTYAVEAIEGSTQADSGNQSLNTAGTWASDAGEFQVQIFKETNTPGVISESVTATDSNDATRTRLADITESTSATDASDRTLSSSHEMTESVTATDAATGGLLSTVDITESASATDSADRSVSASRDITESVTATDSSDRSVTYPVSASESASATDTPNGVLQITSSITEAASGTDAADSVVLKLANMEESVTATSAEDRLYTAGGTMQESASASDTPAATYQTTSSQTETASATESSDGTVGQLVEITESTSATEVSSVTAQQVASQTESVSATDSPDSDLATSAAITESVTAVSAEDGSVTASQSYITEAASASDSASATQVSQASITEATSPISTQTVPITSLILSMSKGAMSSSGTTVVVTYPAGIERRDSILLIITAPVSINASSQKDTESVLHSQTSVYTRVFYREARGYEGGTTENYTLASSSKASWICLRVAKGISIFNSLRIQGSSSSITPSKVSAGNRELEYTSLVVLGTANNNVPATPSSGYSVLNSQLGGASDGASVWIQRKENQVLSQYSSETIGNLTITSANYIAITLVLCKNEGSHETQLQTPIQNYTESSTLNRLSSSSSTAVGQSFYAQDHKISKITVLAKKAVGTATGTLSMKIYASGGRWDSANIPTGSPLFTSSNTVNANSIPTDAYAPLDFYFNPGFKLISGKAYFIVVEGSGLNTLSIHLASSSGYISRSARFSGGAWASSGNDIMYWIHRTEGFYPVYKFNDPNWLDNVTDVSGHFQYFTLKDYPEMRSIGYYGNVGNGVVEKITDPFGSGRQVLHLYNPDGSNGWRAQMDFPVYEPWYKPQVFHASIRMYINPDLAYFSQSSQSLSLSGTWTWLTLYEIWNERNPEWDGDIGGSCRWSFGLHKNQGAGQPLRWGLTADYKQPANIENTVMYPKVTNTSVNAADYFGQWITLRVYMKRGNSTDGILRYYIKRDGFPEELILNINNHTIYPNHPELGLNLYTPFKLYCGSPVTTFLASGNKRFEAWFSDVTIYEDDLTFGLSAIEESVAALDVTDATKESTFKAVLESVSALDVITRVSTQSALVTALLTATDQPDATRVLINSQSESTSPVSVQDAVISALAGFATESGMASDTQDATLTPGVSVQLAEEIVSALDYIQGKVSRRVAVIPGGTWDKWKTEPDS